LFGQNRIELFTDYNQNGVTYRTHPNFNPFGEWYDWAMVKFESEDVYEILSDNAEYAYYARDLYPAKVLCFLRAADETIHAMTHCCVASDHSEDSISCVTLEKEYRVEDNILVPLLRCVSIDTSETPCFLVKDKHRLCEEMGVDLKKINNGITLVKARDEGWPKELL